MFRRKLITASTFALVLPPGCIGLTEDDDSPGQNKKTYQLSSLHIVNHDKQSHEISVKIVNKNRVVHKSNHSIAAKEGSTAGSKRIKNAWPSNEPLKIKAEIRGMKSNTAKIDLKKLGKGDHDINILIENSSPSFWTTNNN